MIRLVTERIDVAEVLASVADPEHGGAVLFVGTTRRERRGRAVSALEFEAYEELAVSELEALALEIATRHRARVAAIHRLGWVPVGEVTVAIAASSRGREGAFLACREMIDGLKARAPVWKRSAYEDGASEWSAGP